MKKGMEDELWLKKIKDNLKDYSEPLPAGGWERLEKELTDAAAPVVAPHRIIPFRRWAVAAAAVLLVAVSSVSLWLLQSGVGDEMRRMSVPALAVAPDALPEQAAPAVQSLPAEPLLRTVGKPSGDARKTGGLLMAQQIDIPTDDEQPETVVTTEPTDTSADTQPEGETVENDEHESAAPAEASEERRKDRYRPSGRDKLHLPDDSRGTSSSGSKGWTVGLSVGNTGGLSLEGGEDYFVMADAPGTPIYGGKVDLSSMANGILTIPEGQELVFKDGIPYLMRSESQIADIDHKQPISFGVSVRKNLAKGFSLESGLTYTYLASDVRYEGSSETLSQKLHYLGIPVRVNWNFVDMKNFTLYASVGGAIEKCVYGKIGTENETVKPVQLSVMGAVGAQYNVSRRVGLYVEPGVSYFFDDGSSVQTIRKENPCNFTLQAGVRLTY